MRDLLQRAAEEAVLFYSIFILLLLLLTLLSLPSPRFLLDCNANRRLNSSFFMSQ